MREVLPDGTARLRVGLRGGQSVLLTMLGAALEPPHRLLYILHTSCTSAPLGRYESPDLDGPDIEAFSKRFGAFLAQDARHDVWLYSMAEGGPVVLDRYNMVYVYGPIERVARLLQRGGVVEVAAWAAPRVPYPHALHYHREFDALETDVLAAIPWVRKPLRDADVQWWSGPEAV